EYDGAEPSATSVSALNLLALSHLTGEEHCRELAELAIASVGTRLEKEGRAVPLMAAALGAALAPPEQIVVVGPAGRADTDALWQQAHRRYRPFTVMLPVEPGPAQDALAELLPWIGSMGLVDDK